MYICMIELIIVLKMLPECLVKTMLMKFFITTIILCKYQSLGKIAIKFLQ